jgi:hypothetical protein
MNIVEQALQVAREAETVLMLHEELAAVLALLESDPTLSDSERWERWRAAHDDILDELLATE